MPSGIIANWNRKPFMVQTIRQAAAAGSSGVTREMQRQNARLSNLVHWFRLLATSEKLQKDKTTGRANWPTARRAL
jgi:hypothetical protein